MTHELIKYHEYGSGYAPKSPEEREFHDLEYYLVLLHNAIVAKKSVHPIFDKDLEHADDMLRTFQKKYGKRLDPEAQRAFAEMKQMFEETKREFAKLRSLSPEEVSGIIRGYRKYYEDRMKK